MKLDQDKAHAARALTILRAAAARIEKSHPGVAPMSSPEDIEQIADAVDEVLHFVLRPRDYQEKRR